MKVAQSGLTLCDPMDHTVQILYGQKTPGQNTGVGSLSLLQGNLPNPGIEPRSPVLWADSLPAEPQRKPKNTGVGSLSLLQLIFPIQELNWGLLHCRWILYQLSYQGSLPSDYFLLAPFPVLPPKCCPYPSFFFPARPPSLWQFSPLLRLQLAPRIYISRYSFSPLLLSFSQRPPRYLHSYSGQNLYSHLSSRSFASPRLITHWFYFCTVSPICFSSPLFCMLIIPNLKR